MKIRTKIIIIIVVLAVVSVGISEIYCFNELKNIKENNELLKSDLFSGNFTLTYYDNNKCKIITKHSAEIDSVSYGNLNKIGQGNITYYGDVNNTLNKVLKFDILGLNNIIRFNTASDVSNNEIENFKNIWEEKSINDPNNKDNLNKNIDSSSKNIPTQPQTVTPEQAKEIAINYWEKNTPGFKRTDFTYTVSPTPTAGPNLNCYQVKTYINTDLYPSGSPEFLAILGYFGSGTYMWVKYDGSIPHW
jgi:hypothetical protein